MFQVKDPGLQRRRFTAAERLLFQRSMTGAGLPPVKLTPLKREERAATAVRPRGEMNGCK